ncbi:MAG: sulfite exporter TauE/SafE family protein [Clostridia bacterium]|nr:sulfite exporter TauE/SafE family protein [Clostridia bacterium]
MKKESIKNILIGFLAGVISGFFGAGGGLILVPFMTIILKKEETTSRATTIFCIFFMVITSSFFYFKKDAIDFILSAKCIIGGIIGSYFGTKLLYKLKNNILKILFIIFLIYSGIKMII